MITITWDEVFETGVVSERTKALAEKGSSTAKAISCAIALMAWATCMSGNKPPDNFGFGMIALAEWSGLSASDLMPDNAKAVADKALSEINS